MNYACIYKGIYFHSLCKASEVQRTVLEHSAEGQIQHTEMYQNSS